VDIISHVRPIANRVFGDFLWAAILVPILAISWEGFYTIARDVGIPPLFAAGLSAAFDGMALFAARIGLKHRRKGYGGFLARLTVVLFAALGAFVQSFHAETHTWIHAHSWIVWSVAPIAAALSYELHLGWVHRKQLAARGHIHPSAKSGYGPVTWIMFPRETLHEYRDVLRSRRTFISKSNMRRFRLEEAEQPKLPSPKLSITPPSVPKAPPVPSTPPLPKTPPMPTIPPVPSPAPTPVPAPVPTTSPVPSPRPVPSTPVPSTQVPSPRMPSSHSVPNVENRPPSAPSSNRRPPARAASQIHAVPSPKPARKPSSRPKTSDDEIRDWCEANGYELGFNRRIPIAGLRAYRAAHKDVQSAAS
jgi:Protein of unknown function (DUF2637)